MKLPALRPGAAVIPMEGGLQVRLGDEEVYVLRTAAPERARDLLAALDGRHDRASVLAGAAPDAAHLLDEILGQLAAAGLLSAARTEPLDDVARYLSHGAVAAEDPAAALRGARVSIVEHGQSSSLMARILTEHGLLTDMLPPGALSALGGGAPASTKAPAKAGPAPGTAPISAGLPATDVLVFVSEAPDLALCLEVNRAACQARVPCLFVDISHGRHATVGPFFVPGEGACLACLRARLRETTAAFAELDAADRLMLESRQPLPAFGCLPAHRHLVCGLAAGEVVAFFTRHRPLRTLSRAITVALEQAETWSEPVHRVPWCEACS